VTPLLGSVTNNELLCHKECIILVGSFSFSLNILRSAEVWLHSSFTQTFDGDEGSVANPGRYTPAAHWTGGWVDLRAGMNTLEKG
jgi:hypothetical protein